MRQPFDREEMVSQPAFALREPIVHTPVAQLFSGQADQRGGSAH
jgi:hypothetical protein